MFVEILSHFTENVTFVESIYPNPTDDRLTVIVKPGLEIETFTL